MKINAFEKILKVKENLSLLRKKKGLEFTYILPEFTVENNGEKEVIISQGEVGRIIKYLEKTGYLEILNEIEESLGIKINGDLKKIRTKTLELISRELKDYYSGNDIIELLKESGVPSSFIIYPESKWLMFFRVLQEMSISRDSGHQKIFSTIITSAIHPLNLGGDASLTKILVNKFNSWLKYDNYIILEKDSHDYVLFENVEYDDIDERIEEMIEENDKRQEEQSEIELSILKKDKNVETIALLHKSYRTMMGLVESFCQDYCNPTTELNDYYQKLILIITDAIKKLNLDDNKGPIEINSFSEYAIKNYCIPFNSLFSAESDYRKNKTVLSWDNIRPEMNMMYGQIDNLYQLVNASDILSEPNEQKILNDISLYLSESKKRNLKTKKDIARKNDRGAPIKIEIVKAPIIKTEAQDKNYIIKNSKKRITLPKFPRTEWSHASIMFLDDRSILLSNDKGSDKKPSTFEGFGCDDTRSSPAKPDENWNFLLKLAQNNGYTKPIGKADRKKQTKQKQKITDILRKIFQNDTDPFETEKGGVYRAKFEITYPNYSEGDVAIKDKYFDLNDIRSKMTEPTQENIEHDLKDKRGEISE